MTPPTSRELHTLGTALDQMARADRAEARAAELSEKMTEYDALFKMQHSRTVHADKLWQTAHGQPDIFPDLGTLIDWLMSRMSKAEARAALLETRLWAVLAALEDFYSAWASGDTKWINVSSKSAWKVLRDAAAREAEAALASVGERRGGAGEVEGP